MGKLLLLFIVLPAVELGLLIEIGKRIGVVETVVAQELAFSRRTQSSGAASRV